MGRGHMRGQEEKQEELSVKLATQYYKYIVINGRQMNNVKTENHENQSRFCMHFY
jgi:hypothetical protein